MKGLIVAAGYGTRFLFLALIAVLIFFFLPGCTVRQDISLNRDGSGTAELTIGLKPMLVGYFQDLMEFAGADPGSDVFDADAVREAFADIPELTLNSAEILDTGTLRLDIAFTDIEKAFYSQVGADVPPAVRIAREPGGTEASFYYGVKNHDRIIERVLEITGLALFNDYLFGLLTPGPAEEILDMYEFVFEEYSGSRSVEKIMRESEIVLTFSPPSRITPLDGKSSYSGTPVPGGKVRYVLPVLDLLTLTNDISFSFLYN
jgi:hypothetical protein